MRSHFILPLALLSFHATAQQPEHGAVRQQAGSAWQAWDRDTAQWVGIERFWVLYAERRGGLTWGRGADYPDYAKVKEGDTFVVEVAQGPCLMEFFHERWRRANDVRRWDDALNDYAGCPYVFD
jgi:hypothetical protein